MLILPTILLGLGLSCFLIKRTFVGALLGVNLLFLGATAAFVFSGLGAGEFGRGYVFALFVAIAGVCQLILGWALALRLYYQSESSDISFLRNLRG